MKTPEMKSFKVIFMGAIITCPFGTNFLAFNKKRHVVAFVGRPEIIGGDWHTIFERGTELSRLLNVEAEHWMHSLRNIKMLTKVTTC